MPTVLAAFAAAFTSAALVNLLRLPVTDIVATGIDRPKLLDLADFPAGWHLAPAIAAKTAFKNCLEAFLSRSANQRRPEAAWKWSSLWRASYEANTLVAGFDPLKNTPAIRK